MILTEARLGDGTLKYQFRKPFDDLAKLLRRPELHAPASVPESRDSGLGSKQKEWGQYVDEYRTFCGSVQAEIALQIFNSVAA